MSGKDACCSGYAVRSNCGKRAAEFIRGWKYNLVYGISGAPRSKDSVIEEDFCCPSVHKTFQWYYYPDACKP